MNATRKNVELLRSSLCCPLEMLILFRGQFHWCKMFPSSAPEAPDHRLILSWSSSENTQHNDGSCCSNVMHNKRFLLYVWRWRTKQWVFRLGANHLSAGRLMSSDRSCSPGRGKRRNNSPAATFLHSTFSLSWRRRCERDTRTRLLRSNQTDH